MAPMMAAIQFAAAAWTVDQMGRNVRKVAIQFNADDSASAVISTEPAIDVAVNEGHSCGLGATSSGQFQIQPAAPFTRNIPAKCCQPYEIAARCEMIYSPNESVMCEWIFLRKYDAYNSMQMSGHKFLSAQEK